MYSSKAGVVSTTVRSAFAVLEQARSRAQWELLLRVKPGNRPGVSSFPMPESWCRSGQHQWRKREELRRRVVV